MESIKLDGKRPTGYKLSSDEEPQLESLADKVSGIHSIERVPISLDSRMNDTSSQILLPNHFPALLP